MALKKFSRLDCRRATATKRAKRRHPPRKQRRIATAPQHLRTPWSRARENTDIIFHYVLFLKFLLRFGQINAK